MCTLADKRIYQFTYLYTVPTDSSSPQSFDGRSIGFDRARYSNRHIQDIQLHFEH